MVDSVLAVVPLTSDDRGAPGGCAGLVELRGRSLVGRVVDALVASGCVDRVVVAAPPAAVEALVAELGDRSESRTVIEVREVVADGVLARLSAVLDVEPADVVVVHDPLYPLAPVDLVGVLLDALAATPSAVGVVPLGPVTDTLKRVDEDGAVIGTVDRAGYRTVHVPQAYRAAPLRATLADAGPESLHRSGPQVLVELVRGAGGWVVAVPAPAEAVRVVDEDGLVLADAMLGPSSLTPGRAVARPAGGRSGK